MHDATQINADWGDQWPTDLSDAINHDHERSPILMAPVATLSSAHPGTWRRGRPALTSRSG